MNNKKDIVKRYRNWACIVYPESAPDDWLNILRSHKVPAFVSPLHNLDIDNGKPKKAHWHVMVMFEGNKTLEQFTEISSSFGGVGTEVVKSLRGYSRYLCHLDETDKVKYPVDDVICVCGADYNGVISLVADEYRAIAEMLDFCVENNIRSFAELFLYSRSNNFPWFKVLCDKGSTVEKFIKSYSWTNDTSSWSNCI